jgi:multiple sugar transport system permease protein
MAGRQQRVGSRGWGNENGVALAFIAPYLLLFLAFLLVPSVISLFVGLFKYDLFGGTLKFVGLKNFVKMFNDELFYKALVNTAVYNLFVIPISVVLSLLLAVMVNQKLRGVGFLRGIYFLPAIVALVASGFAWRWMLGVEGGWINYYLSFLDIKPHAWLNDQNTALGTIIAVAVWQSIAGKMIIFLGSLKAVPEELYDATRIDGASGPQTFFRITLPLIRYTTFFVIVITVIDEVKVFAKAFILTVGGLSTHFNILGGEPNYSTLTLVGYIYGIGFRFLDFGYGAAISIFMFAVMLVFTMLQFRYYRRSEP